MASLYQSKVRSAADAAALLRPRDTLTVPLGPGQPAAVLEALGARDDYEQLDVFSALLLAPYSLFFKKGVRLLSGFYGPVERNIREQGFAVEFVPADFRRYAHVARRLASRVMVTVAAPPDAAGNMSLSLHAGATVDEMHRAAADPDRLLIVEVNSSFPRTFGLGEHTHSISVEEADVLVESDVPGPVLPDVASDALSRRIAEHVSDYVRDGATLQTGIGGIPSDVVSILAAGPCGNFGIHSEMFTTGLMKLYQAGKVANTKGSAYDGYSICTFALGSAELHAWLHEQDKVRFLPVSIVNDAGMIGANRNMISINGALSVDLTGQITADTIAGRQFSGIGGHEDFVCGSSMAPGGHSIVCLPSTATVGGKPVSRITATLPAGGIVTTPRHQTDVIVTEHGAAELAGLTVAERARALIAIAHPDFRDALAEEAARLPR